MISFQLCDFLSIARLVVSLVNYCDLQNVHSNSEVKCELECIKIVVWRKKNLGICMPNNMSNMYYRRADLAEISWTIEWCGRVERCDGGVVDSSALQFCVLVTSAKVLPFFAGTGYILHSIFLLNYYQFTVYDPFQILFISIYSSTNSLFLHFF